VILLSSLMIQEPLVVSMDFSIRCVLLPLEKVIIYFRFYIHLLFLSSSPNFWKENSIPPRIISWS